MKYSAAETTQQVAEIDATDARVRIQYLIDGLRATKPTRELALAITKLQEAFFWLDEVNRLS